MPSRQLIVVPFLCAALLSTSAASFRAPVPKQTAAEELKARDLRKLQGRWAVVREVVANTLQEGDRGAWTFKEGTVKVNNRAAEAFTIDTAARPKRLARTYTDEAGKKRTAVYIYTFDDDHLLLSARFLSSDENNPPFDFSTGSRFLRLERRDE